MEPEQTIRYLGIVTESLNNREETEKVFTECRTINLIE